MPCRSSLLVLFVAGFIALAIACGSTPPAQEAEPGTTASDSTPPPAASAPTVTRVADLFPDAPAKPLVLNNCAGCHNVACSVIGQRPAARWDSLRMSHADKGEAEELDAIFAYLKTNFDDTKPEPAVPPQFLEGGCTPF